MRVGKQEKDLGELSLLKKVGQKLHSIGAYNTNVLVAASHMARLLYKVLIVATLFRIFVLSVCRRLHLRLEL